MIFGTGKPSIKLLAATGAQAAVITLERPQRREVQDWEPVVQQLGQDQYGEPITVLRGYRFRCVIHWLATSRNTATMAQLLRVGNWRGGGRTVRFWPHEEQTAVRVRCEVVRCDVQPWSGLVAADEVVLELRGVDVVAQRPNPTLDRVGSRKHMRSIISAEAFGS